jgi:hypothetical protein
VILVSDRGTEEGHDAVAGVLVHRAFEPMHPLGEDLEEAIEDLVPLLRIELVSQLRRALYVREQYCDVLALTFERAPRGEDLLGKMLRGVRVRRAETRLGRAGSCRQ